MAIRLPTRMLPTLVLVPTPLERDGLLALGGFPGLALERVGFGPVAAAARTAALLFERRPRRALLLGIAGSLRPDALAVGTATSPSAVRLEGLGARLGARLLPPSELGFPQWQDEHGRIEERLALAGGRGGELVTVCVASGSRAEARRRARAYPRARVEDMEGFGVAFACHLARVPLVVVRGISNVAGERDPRRWDVPAALAAAHALARAWLARADWGRRT